MRSWLLFALGIPLWPILEYSLHRVLGHTLPANTKFKQEHLRHHVEGNYFAPVRLKILSALPVSLLLWLLFWLVYGSPTDSLCFVGGVLCMYAFYEWTHWSFHVYPPTTRIGLRLRLHHFAHHFQDAKKNHGVTTTIIDHALGTYLAASRVATPEKLAMRWVTEAPPDAWYRDRFDVRAG